MVAGHVQVGDAVTVEAYPGEAISALTMFRDFYRPTLSEATVRKYLAAPIASRARADYESQLHQLLKNDAE